MAKLFRLALEKVAFAIFNEYNFIDRTMRFFLGGSYEKK
jgi:hypothetical protein